MGLTFGLPKPLTVFGSWAKKGPHINDLVPHLIQVTVSASTKVQHVTVN